MVRNKDDVEAAPAANGGNGQDLSPSAGQSDQESVVVATLQRDLADRESAIRQLEASLELEGRVSATLRESLRKLTERIARLEESFGAGRAAAAAAASLPAEADAPASQDAAAAVGGMLAEMQADLSRVTAERDALRDQIKVLERMQTETVTLPEDEDLAATGRPASGPESIDVQPSINELIESLSSIQRPAVDPGMHGLAGSGEHGRDEPWGDMIAPELMAPEAFDADEETSKQRIPKSVAKIFGSLVTLDDKKARHLLKNQVTTIGRAPSCDIQINAAHISRMHARILSDDSSLVIEDAGSKNGLQVNDHDAERCVLKLGDVVKLGPVSFVVCGPHEADESRAAVVEDSARHEPDHQPESEKAQQED